MIMFRWTQTGPSKTDIWTCVCHIHDRWKEHHVETGNHGFFQHHGNIDTPQKVQSKTDVILPTASTASLFGTSFAHTCPVIGVPCGHLEWSVRMPWCTCGREGASFVSNWSKIDLMLILSCWLNSWLFLCNHHFVGESIWIPWRSAFATKGVQSPVVCLCISLPLVGFFLKISPAKKKQTHYAYALKNQINHHV